MTSSFLGIDIAKKKFDVAFIFQNKFKHKIFFNNQNGFDKLTQWLKQFKLTQIHACMEATNIYGEALAAYLFDAGFNVSIVNPAQIKSFAQSQLTRNKNDSVDAKLIAQFCQIFQPPLWQPAPIHIRELQALVRRLDALLEMQNQENNRLLVAHPPIIPSIESVIATLKTEIKSVRQRIRNHIDHNPDLRQRRDLLDSIPGIGDATIAQVLAFIGDVTRFKNAKHIAAFVGLNPKQHQSGSSVKGKTRLSKIGSASLRKVFYMPALVSIKHNPIIKIFSQRLKQNGKNMKSIICAVMRKLIHIIYGVLKSQQPFNPNLHST